MTKYTEEVKKILKISEQEMLKLSHNFVGTEHFILAVLNTDNEIKDILNKNSIYYDNFKAKLNQYIQKNDINKNTIIYTPLFKRILLNANKGNDNLITLKDIILSFLEEGEGIGITLLNSMKLDLNSFYRTLKNRSTDFKYGINLNNEVINGNITKTINREKEINEVIEALIRKNKCNPLLVGKAGTGKTAIVEGLAYNIVHEAVPKFMRNKQIISISLSSIVSGTRYRGEFEEKLHEIIKFFEENQDFILFIDEIHTLVGAGGAEGAIDASNILKPYLARNKIKCIGATTEIEYKKSILQDKALNRRFQKIDIKEPSIEETKFILKSIKDIYEKYHNVSITNAQIDMIVDGLSKELDNIANPDKSLDILDEVCAKTSIYDYNEQMNKLNDKINTLIKQKEEALISKNYKNATLLKIEENKLNKKRKDLKPKVKNTTIQQAISKKKKTKTIVLGYDTELLSI